MSLISFSTIKFIKNRKDWIRVWDFHFSIWFLDRLIEMHLKYPERLGNENRNTLHLFKNGSESAYFLQGEIDKLKSVRKKKLLNRRLIDNHYKSALLSIKKMDKFSRKLQFKNNSEDGELELILEYSELLKDLLSYYRASRPEIFEIVEEMIRKDNPKKISYYKKLIDRYGHLRLDIKRAWLKAEQRARKLKTKVASNMGIKSSELEYLTTDEISKLYGTKKYNFKNLVKKRKFCIFGIIHGKKIIIDKKEEVKLIFNLLELKIKKGTKEIKGKIASRGFLVGRVRLIPQTNYQEMIKRAKMFKKGEILVTGMTQPDIMFACRKAGAIITDEGGITSHAAIISRELNIPCIIGTKIATRVLRDGQLVEVNANKGVVKILKRFKD